MQGPQRKIAFLHTAAPAIPPLIQFYSEAAPDLRLVNLMEDGLLDLLAQGNHDVVLARLRTMVQASRDVYGAELAMITCSSVPLSMARTLSDEMGLPVIKIDGPMARKAVEAGSRIGVAVTFPPTIEPTSRLLRETAAAMGREIELVTHVVGGAYQALLAADYATHDRLLIEGIKELAGKPIDSIVLAQVSMARVRSAASDVSRVPVFSSLDTSLSAIRQLMASG